MKEILVRMVLGGLFASAFAVLGEPTGKLKSFLWLASGKRCTGFGSSGSNRFMIDVRLEYCVSTDIGRYSGGQ